MGRNNEKTQRKILESMITKCDKSSFKSYLFDAANIMGDCERIYFPENQNDIVNVVNAANESKKIITISAARTGLNGGCVPKEGLILSVEKMNKLLSVDVENKIAVVEPGLTLNDLQNELDRYGLYYPPDPTETNCTIGGTVANNASGARTFKYGPTRDFIHSITVILPDGDELLVERGLIFSEDLLFNFESQSGRRFIFRVPEYKMPDVKHSGGYYCKPNMDLIDLFIGSEGTLGIISQITLKLMEKPENVISMVVFFMEEKDLFSFINEIRDKTYDHNNKLDLREIEFFDENTLNLLKEEYSNIPENSKGGVWIEQEITNETEELFLEEIELSISANNASEDDIWYAIDENERKKLRDFRHKIALKVNEIISSRGLVKVGTDTAVPNNRFSDFYNFTTSLIESNKIEYVTYGHIGNSHLHFNMLPKTKDELALCRNLYAKICTKSVELNGTISAEHGIGKLKTKYLLEMFGEQNILQMAKLKKTFDPNIILNIGNIFDEKFIRVV